MSLPVDEILPQLLETIRESGCAVLQAPPGAGKTTRVPPALLPIAEHGKRILLLQPRRLAARSAAARLAYLMQSSVGDRVGYQVRFDRRIGATTEIVAMTTGILLRRLIDDPFLEDVDCVILDEFHERSVEVDLALGMLLRLRQTVRPELKLVVMSATIAADAVARFLDTDAIRSEGRAYPVDIRFARRPERAPVDEQIARLLPSVLQRAEGDVLVFLPGVGEIRRTAAAIEATARSYACDIYELFGEMKPEAQDRVLQPQSRRKIVLATNVAETSVTIDGITVVIDSGLARVPMFDAAVGLPRLELQPISKASADQRAGRAGRTQPGLCYRLWTESTHRGRPDFDRPEVIRTDLTPALLLLASWGERDPREFPWLDRPSDEAIETARQTLHLLGALHDGEITSTGTQLANMPLHPRLGRILRCGVEQGEVDHAAIIAALLSERDPFRGPSGRGPRQRTVSSEVPRYCESDIVNRAIALARYADGTESVVLNAGAARQVLRIANDLRRQLSIPPSAKTAPDVETLRRVVLAGYPDRVAARRKRRDPRGVLVGGRGVKLDPKSCVTESELFVCVDVEGSGANALVRQASAIDQAWLDPSLMRTATEHFFHPSLQAIAARRRTYYVDLLLEETPTEVEPALAAELLFAEAEKNWNRVFPADDKSLRSFLGRYQFWVDAQSGEGNWQPAEVRLEEVCRQLCCAARSFADLKAAPWLDTLQALLGFDFVRKLNAEVPVSWQAPSGSSLPIEYPHNAPPTVSIRIQELFGLPDTPRIAGGKVKLRFQLLAPNQRPQQLTDDLASFWQNTYPVIKKELAGRYSKHYWPDDPLSAQATQSGLARDARS